MDVTAANLVRCHSSGRGIMSYIHQPKQGSIMKILVIAGVILPLCGLFLLLIWGQINSDGLPANVAINSAFGEVTLDAKEARNFEIELLNGSLLELVDLKGTIVMIDFWSSWCPPCQKEAPVLNVVYQGFKSKGVEFIGISIWDSETDAVRFYQKHSVAYPVGLDRTAEIAIDYGVTGIPEKHFIDRNGQLIRKVVGPVTQRQLQDILEELLDGS